MFRWQLKTAFLRAKRGRTLQDSKTLLVGRESASCNHRFRGHRFERTVGRSFRATEDRDVEVEVCSSQRTKLVLRNLTSQISQCARSTCWPEALNLFATIPTRRLEADVICYSAAISASEKGALWQNAFILLERMREVKLQPDVFSYNSAISSCCDWRYALALLQTMCAELAQPDVVSYNAIMCALGLRRDNAILHRNRPVLPLRQDQGSERFPV